MSNPQWEEVASWGREEFPGDLDNLSVHNEMLAACSEDYELFEIKRSIEYPIVLMKYVGE